MEVSSRLAFALLIAGLIAGWALALIQTWRLRRARRPYLNLEATRFNELSLVQLSLTVRNRGPHDIYVRRIELLKPKQPATLVYKHFSGLDSQGNPIFVEERARSFQVLHHLPAHAQGEFPSVMLGFAADVGTTAVKSVTLGVYISPTRDPAQAKRWVVRQRVEIELADLGR